MFTIAWNLSELERSPRSPEMSFIVTIPKAATSAQPAPVHQPTAKPEVPSPISTPTNTGTVATTSTSANSLLDWFFNKSSSTEASSTPTSTSFFDTNIGRIFLIIVILLALGILVFNMFRPKYEESVSGDEGKNPTVGPQTNEPQPPAPETPKDNGPPTDSATPNSQ